MFIGGKRISLELASTLLELEDDEEIATPSSIIESPKERDLDCLKPKTSSYNILSFEGRKRVIAKRDKITNKLKDKINDLYGKNCVNDLDNKSELEKYKKGKVDCMELATTHKFDYWKEERRRSACAFHFSSEKLKLFLNFMNWKNEDEDKFHNIKEFIIYTILQSFRKEDKKLSDIIIDIFIENSSEDNPLSKMMECSYNCKYWYGHEMLYPTCLIFCECIDLIEKENIKKIYEYYSRGRLIEYDLPIIFISNISRRFKSKMTEIENMTI